MRNTPSLIELGLTREVHPHFLYNSPQAAAGERISAAPLNSGACDGDLTSANLGIGSLFAALRLCDDAAAARAHDTLLQPRRNAGSICERPR
jgi:hypothetical protein